MRTIDRRDRVELNRGQPPDRGLDLVGVRPPEPRRESLLGDDEPPDRRDAGHH